MPSVSNHHPGGKATLRIAEAPLPKIHPADANIKVLITGLALSFTIAGMAVSIRRLAGKAELRIAETLIS